jgi:hypothetical protein
MTIVSREVLFPKWFLKAYYYSNWQITTRSPEMARVVVDRLIKKSDGQIRL